MSINLKKEILALKNEKKATIVAHNYQVDEVQEIADIIGDSLALSRYCADHDSELIVFCGVHFMAESAKILSPHKTVLLPEADAGCPMADMVTPERLIEAKRKYPGAVVVCYVNSSAAVKAESDICCTSSNAVQVVRSLKEKDVLFVPDMNLANFVAQKIPEKNIIPWKGFCITHHRISKEEVEKMRVLHPDAEMLVHPECHPDIVKLADFAGSTQQIIQYAEKSTAKKFIIGTEMGVLCKLKNDNPDKIFYLMSPGLVCPNMKKTSLESVYYALRDMKYAIEVDEEIRIKAKVALDRMLEIR